MNSLKPSNAYHLGINLGHDRSAAIARNGNIEVAIHQERLDRIKNSTGFLHQSLGDCKNIQIPHEAVQYCLRTCNIKMDQLSSITANMPGIDYSEKILKRVFPRELSDRIHAIPGHHLSHAYSAYWPSGFDEAIILVVDATGSTDKQGLTESYSLYAAVGTEISLLHGEKIPSYLASLSTLGFVYEYITKLAGFYTPVGLNLDVPEAGKLMGLAPYGTPCDTWNRWLKTVPGSYSIDISAYDIFLEVEALRKLHDNGKGKAYLRPYIVDLAYKVQSELEQALLHIVEIAVNQTGCKKLCCAGGVALNSVANYKLWKELDLEDIFIFPAAGDAGIAAGNALWAYHILENGQQRPHLSKATLGKVYDEGEIEAAIGKFGSEIIFEKKAPNEVVATCAEHMATGKIIARYEGGSEFGPRALGHRSIVADPAFTMMKDILNSRVKFREAFRPFAPVIPLENVSEVFEQDVASPFMLLVSSIKEKYHKQIPSVTHCDGTGRVQTATPEENGFFYDLCKRVVAQRGGLPVILNTSFNIAGQPIVETPEEAIATFLMTDIDFLSLENYWIRKKNSPASNYKKLPEGAGISPYPKGLSDERINVTDLMEKLDQAIFKGKTQNLPWSRDELTTLSAKGAVYRETSALCEDSPLGRAFSARLGNDLILLLNPLGMSEIRDLRGRATSKPYTYEEIRLIMLSYYGTDEEIHDLRIELNLPEKVFRNRLAWALDQLEKLSLTPKFLTLPEQEKDVVNFEAGDTTLAQFKDESFCLRGVLEEFSTVLAHKGFSEESICKLLEIQSLQEIEPTHIHYYDAYKLGAGQLEDLIRLFLLRGSLAKERITEILGDYCFHILCNTGVLLQRGELFASRVDLYCVNDFYIATDHRYMIHEEDKIGEDPVMYIGPDSLGLVHTAPVYYSKSTLDLCTGSGVQALAASCYSKEVTGIDINPRAIRFARFNAQLNGVRNVRFMEGNLYQPIGGKKFLTILANPPFVPSPYSNLEFRDGGSNGERVLEIILGEANEHLEKNGRIFIVTDLVNVPQYPEKLNTWWGPTKADTLLLTTAARNDILFSVPHCHHPFGQTLDQYNEKLDTWIRNFNDSGIEAVNFGYILIKKGGNSLYCKSVHNPVKPINDKVKEYFEQVHMLGSLDWKNLYLKIPEGINFRINYSFNTDKREIYIFSHNQFYSEYLIGEEVFRFLRTVSEKETVLGECVHKEYVLDLIYKGIVKVGTEKPALKTLDFYETRKRSASGGTPVKPEGNERLRIMEFQTKTTPTCLTSYIRQ